MIGRSAETASQVRDVPSGVAQQRDGGTTAEHLIIWMRTDDKGVALTHTYIFADAGLTGQSTS